MHPVFAGCILLMCSERTRPETMKKFKLFSYNPPAKGVAKEDDRASVQTDFPGFFIMYGRKFWNLSNLNLLIAVYILILSLGVWQLSAYPIAFYIFLGVCSLLFGIVNTGASYVVRGYVRGDPVYILSDFRYAVKHNWRQGIALGLVDLVVIVLLVFDLFFWSGMDMNYLASYTESLPGQNTTITGELLPEESDTVSADKTTAGSEAVSKSNAASPEIPEQAGQAAEPVSGVPQFLKGVFFYTCIFLLILYSFMRCYMYIIMVTFKLSLFKILKNSFIFAFLGIKRNILAFLGVALLCFINVYIFVWIPLVGLTLPLIITTASCFFIGAYASYPVIKKYMITPYYKDEEVYEEYDRIFEDRG